MSSSKRAIFLDEENDVSVYVEYPVLGFPESYLIRLSGVYLTILDIPVQLRLIAGGGEEVLTLAQVNGALKAVRSLMSRVASAAVSATYQQFVDEFILTESPDELIRRYYPDISFDWKLRALGSE